MEDNKKEWSPNDVTETPGMSKAESQGHTAQPDLHVPGAAGSYPPGPPCVETPGVGKHGQKIIGKHGAKLSALLLGLFLTLQGCAQVSSVWDGITKVPMTDKDVPSFYHFGSILVPIVGDVWHLVGPFLIGALEALVGVPK